MHRSRAVAATISSVIVFTSLLVSNALVLQGENYRLGAVRAADLEGSEAFNSAVQGALAAYSAISYAQDYLAANPARCSGWDEYTGSLSRAQNSSGDVAGIEYSVESQSSYTTEGAQQDNLTFLSPFAGFLPGSLNLAVTIGVDESAGYSSASSLPHYSKTEVHYVHLPIPLDAALSICSSAMSELGAIGVPAASQNGGCPGLSSEFASLEETYEQLAGQYGLAFTLDTSPEPGCGFSYAVTLSQPAAQGVSGQFAWSVHDYGSLQ